MCASYGQKIFMTLMSVGLVLCLSTGTFSAEKTDSVVPLVVPEPTSSAQTVAYRTLGDTPATSSADKAAAPTETSSCCDPCVTCEPCCDPGGYGHWVAGVEAVWLSPTYQNPRLVEFGIIDAQLAPVAYAFSDSADVNDFYITPRISLGYQGDLWGVQVRYWRMRETVSNSVSPAILGLGYYADGLFKAETFDLEGTRRFDWRETRNVVSFGVRYAQLCQETQLAAVDQILGDGVFTGMGFSRHNFSGTGITLALTGLKPIGSENLNLFYSLRGSIIWDDNALNYVETSAYYGGVGSAGAATGALVNSNGDMFIGEVQVGVQWNFELMRNRADAFLRVAFEYQGWDDNNTGTVAALSGVASAAHAAATWAASGDSRVDLVGFNIATGFTW